MQWLDVHRRDKNDSEEENIDFARLFSPILFQLFTTLYILTFTIYIVYTLFSLLHHIFNVLL
jgi:hypothetical protein